MIRQRPPIEPNPTVFWPLAVLGWGVIGFGVAGLLSDAARTHPTRWATWFLGAAVLHDLVVAPCVLLAGRLLGRHAPRRGRVFLQAGLVMSALVAVAAVPVVLGFGRSPGNPSVLPNDYGAGLLSVVAVVWLLVALSALVSSRFRTSSVARGPMPRPRSRRDRGSGT